MNWRRECGKTADHEARSCEYRWRGGIFIRIDAVAGQEKTVMETIRQCWQDAGGCSAGCRTVGLMEQRIENGSFFLNLASRTSALLHPSSVEERLRHKLQRSFSGSGATEACDCPNASAKQIAGQDGSER